jgi:hypothetical protein
MGCFVSCVLHLSCFGGLPFVDRLLLMKLALVAACLVAALPAALLQSIRQYDTVRYLIPRNTDDCIGPNITVASGACSGVNLYKNSWYRITGTGIRPMDDGSLKVWWCYSSNQALLLPLVACCCCSSSSHSTA